MELKGTDISGKVNRLLADSPPLLPQAELVAWVASYFERRRRYLTVLENHSSPLYLQERTVLEERAAQLRSAFETVLPETAFYYAVKSNNHPNVAGVMMDSGFGLDVSSGIELQMALKLGCRDIVFSGPAKTAAELQLAAAHAEQVVILLDSFGELKRLADIAARQDNIIRCGVRLTVNPQSLWRKFGIVLQDLPAFWREAKKCDRICLQGIQFHTSWNLSPQLQIDFIRRLSRPLSQMPATYLDQTTFIDIGGGYWPEQGEWLQEAATPRGRLLSLCQSASDKPLVHYRMAATPISEYAARLGEAICSHLLSLKSFRICLEPGRFICNDAVQVMISVVDKKADDLVLTDAGTNAVGWERFESDYCPVLNLTRPALQEKPCHILGSLCTPHDIWGYAYWGEGIQVGDVLMIPCQGAYTYSLRQNFIKPLPSVVMI